MTNLQDEPSQSQQTVVESVTPYLVKLFEYGYWDYFSELHNEPAGRTVVVCVTPHLVRLPHLPLVAELCCSSLKISCHVVMYLFLWILLNYVMNHVSSGYHWFV